MRTEFSDKTKLQGFTRAKGRCELCTAFLVAGKIRYDHIIPDQLGGDNILQNLQVLCTTCDSKKTYHQDIPDIAKAKRRQKKAAGIRKPSKLKSRGFEKAPPQRSATRPVERRT